MRRTVLRPNRPNNVGQRLAVPPRQRGLGPGVPVPFFQVRADDEDAQNVNLVLLPAVDPLHPAEHGPCVAIVEWGTGSASVSAEIDVAKGTQVQLSASFLSLSVRNDGAVDDGDGTSVDPTPGTQNVIAMVSGYGGRVAFGKATRTYYFRRVVPLTAPVQVPVPNFAKSVLVTRAAPATTAITIEVLDNLPFPTGNVEFPPGPNRRAAFDFAAGVVPAAIDLYSAAAFVKIRNTGETNIPFLQIAFELCL